MGSDYWQDKLSFNEALLHMLEEKISADFVFVVGETKTHVACHSFILIARSHYFQTMLDSPLLSHTDDGKPCSHVDVVEINEFKAFLKYLYTDVIDLTGDNVMTFLHLSREYLIKSLSTKCQTFITSATLEDPSNAVEIFHHAFLLDIEDIKKDCLNIINQHTKDCLQSEAFLNLPAECVRIIVADDRHQIDEKVLFKSVIKWAEHDCEEKGLDETDENIRRVLGVALFEIRFPLIDEKVFKTKICRRNILNEREKEELLLLYNRKNVKNYKGPFKTYPRKTHQQVLRFEDDEENMLLDNVPHTIAFESTIPCYLHGIATFGLSQISDDLSLHITLTGPEDQCLISEDISLKTTPHQKVYNACFQKAVEIEKDTKYRISLTIEDLNWMWNGKNGKCSVPFRDGEITFLNDQETEDTNTFAGQIAGIVLS